jgi:hypothetical protein
MLTLGKVMPEAKSVVLEGVGRELLYNVEMRGRPAKAVATIREFFR